MKRFPLLLILLICSVFILASVPVFAADAAAAGTVDITAVISSLLSACGVSGATTQIILLVLMGIYFVGNAIMPFLPGIKANGWEHAFWLGWQSLKVNPADKEMTFSLDQLRQALTSQSEALPAAAPAEEPAKVPVPSVAVEAATPDADAVAQARATLQAAGIAVPDAAASDAS